MWPTWTVDFFLGAVWTLIAVTTGALIALVAVALRPEPPAPDDGEPEELPPPSDDDLEAWMRMEARQ